MATQITITNVQYANTPSALQVWSFWYKLSTDSGWTLISNSSNVNTDGTLQAPIIVSGLTPGSVYYIRGAANCESPVENYFIETAQT